MRFLIGVDVGQSGDPSALSIIEEHQGEEYHVRHLKRWPLRTPYTEIAGDVARTVNAEELKGGGLNVLAVDVNGVGAPFCDLLKTYSPSAHLAPVFSHGGDKVVESEGVWRVPKRELVSKTQIALESGRLKIAPGLPEAATLVREMQNYQYEINPLTSHDSYGAWRSGQHDDVLFSLMVAVWCATGVRFKFSVLAQGKAKMKGRALASEVFDRGQHYRKTILG